MSEQMKRGILSGAGLFAVSCMLLAAWLFVARTTEGADAPLRQIVLEARGVAFNETNPTLGLRPGETVRIVVRNNDPGVLHSITIPGIHDRLVHVPAGQEVAFTVRVPDSGSFEYVCPQHAPEMKGGIVVME